MVILIYICTIGIKNIVRYNGFSLEHESLRKDYKNVKEQQLLYESQLKSLKEDIYLEFLAKQRLGYIKKHEQVIKFIRE